MKLQENYDISPLALLRWINSEYEEYIGNEIKENTILKDVYSKYILNY